VGTDARADDRRAALAGRTTDERPGAGRLRSRGG
jgi:hypothetical protein